MKKNTKNSIYLVVGIVSLLGGRFLFTQFNTSKYSQNNYVKDVSFSKTNNKQEVIQTEKELFTPPPLNNLNSIKATYSTYANQNSTFLDSKGVIAFTNIQRERYGFAPLSENIQLDNSAAMKVDDIFQKQYFEHVSPSGVNIEDLSKKNDYDFILIGENLAMGDFKNSRDLVEAWMASPGHRANILKSRYEDIGISVKKGTFKGREVWVAVQHFGLSSKVCPEVDTELKKKVNDQTLTLGVESINLNSLEASVIGGFEDKNKPEYIKNIENYNQKVKTYNQEITKSKEEILKYNNQVKLYNDCVTGNTSKL